MKILWNLVLLYLLSLYSENPSAVHVNDASYQILSSAALGYDLTIALLQMEVNETLYFNLPEYCLPGFFINRVL